MVEWRTVVIPFFLMTFIANIFSYYYIEQLTVSGIPNQSLIGINIDMNQYQSQIGIMGTTTPTQPSTSEASVELKAVQEWMSNFLFSIQNGLSTLGAMGTLIGLLGRTVIWGHGLIDMVFPTTIAALATLGLVFKLIYSFVQLLGMIMIGQQIYAIFRR